MIEVNASSQAYAALWQALSDAGFPTMIHEGEGDGVLVLDDIDEADRVAVEAVIVACTQKVAQDAAVQAVRDGNAKTLRDQAAAAMTTNTAFLAITTPTNAQVLAQTKALTKQNQALIRLATGLLDAID